MLRPNTVKSVRENSDGTPGGAGGVTAASEGASSGKPGATPKSSPPAPELEGPTSEGEAWSYEVAHPGSSSDLTPVVGTNLRRLRVQRGLSLERLAKASGVSRAMLGQIELGRSAPTINVLWKIARALAVPFSALISNRTGGGTVLMPADRAKKLTSHDGKFTSRALFPFDSPRKVEFYELRLAPLAVETADSHPPGTVENLVVGQGTVEITVDGHPHSLADGDAILFEADVPHVYRNPGNVEAIMYLVMTYTESTG